MLDIHTEVDIHIKCLLLASDSNKNWNMPQNLGKVFQHKISRKLVQCFKYTDVQTTRHTWRSKPAHFLTFGCKPSDNIRENYV
jgi:hypothetical protein